MIWMRFAALVIGYILGLFQTGYFYGKLHGIDIREHGSGNAGATNTLRTLGLKAGLITFAGDALKAIFAVLIVTFILGDGFEGDNYIAYIVENLKDVARFLDECELSEIQANKFSALANEKTNYPAVEDALSDRFDFMDHGDGIIEAVPKGTSKATGIAWLCEHLNIAKEDTYALGDSINDLEMLGFVGHSIAMGNASQMAKDAAEYVTTHIHEDGVFNALKHYNLI